MSNEIIYTAGDRTPYTYLIGWSKLNKWYYGSRTKKNCHPGDLWKTYFTSSSGHSKDGKFKDGSHSVKSFRVEFGEPDIIQIRKIFDCPRKCVNFEYTVLRRMKVVNSLLFLNKNDGRQLVPTGMTTAYYPNGTKFGLIDCNDYRFLSGELIKWGNIQGQDGLTNNKRNGIKIRELNNKIGQDGLTGYQRGTILRDINMKKPDENGLTGYEKRGPRIKITNSIVGEDGFNNYERAKIKELETKSVIGEDGLNSNQRGGLKSRISNLIIGDDGFTGYQRAANNALATRFSVDETGQTLVQKAKIKELETKSKVDENGLSGFKKNGIAIQKVRNQLGTDGLTSYQRAGAVISETRRAKAKKYNILNIDNRIIFEYVTEAEIRKIYNCLFGKTKENFLGSTPCGVGVLKRNNKMHLYGCYVVEV